MGVRLVGLLVVVAVVLVPTGLLLISIAETTPEEQPNLFGLPGWAFGAAETIANVCFGAAAGWIVGNRHFKRANRGKPEVGDGKRRSS